MNKEINEVKCKENCNLISTIFVIMTMFVEG
jgi:hypothetical protein